MHAFGNGPQPGRTVIDRVHAGHVGQQYLGRTDVRVGLLATDVLLPRLQGHAQRGLAANVPRYADDPAWCGTCIGLARGEEGGMRSAETQRHAEALRRTEGDVCAQCAGRLEQYQREQIARYRDDAASRLDRRDRLRQVSDPTVRVRILQQGAENIVLRGILGGSADQFEAEVLCACPKHVDGLREGRFVRRSSGWTLPCSHVVPSPWLRRRRWLHRAARRWRARVRSGR